MSNASRAAARLTVCSREKTAAAEQPLRVGLSQLLHQATQRLLTPGKGCLPAGACTRVCACVCMLTHTYTYIHTHTCMRTLSFKVPIAVEAKTTWVMMLRWCFHIALEMVEGLR